MRGEHTAIKRGLSGSIYTVWLVLFLAYSPTKFTFHLHLDVQARDRDIEQAKINGYLPVVMNDYDSTPLNEQPPHGNGSNKMIAATQGKIRLTMVEGQAAEWPTIPCLLYMKARES